MLEYINKKNISNMHTYIASSIYKIQSHTYTPINTYKYIWMNFYTVAVCMHT